MIIKFDKFVNESLRDKLKGKSKEEVINKFNTKLKKTLPNNELSLDDIDNIADEDDLNTAMFELQSIIGQEYGDVCGLYFSNLDDPEKEWEESSKDERLSLIYGYLAMEISYL